MKAGVWVRCGVRWASEVRVVVLLEAYWKYSNFFDHACKTGVHNLNFCGVRAAHHAYIITTSEVLAPIARAYHGMNYLQNRSGS